MNIAKHQQAMREKHELLFTYFDTVMVDFDNEVEMKKIKEIVQEKKPNKKQKNK